MPCLTLKGLYKQFCSIDLLCTYSGIYILHWYHTTLLVQDMTSYSVYFCHNDIWYRSIRFAQRLIHTINVSSKVSLFFQKYICRPHSISIFKDCLCWAEYCAEFCNLTVPYIYQFSAIFFLCIFLRNLIFLETASPVFHLFHLRANYSMIRE